MSTAVLCTERCVGKVQRTRVLLATTRVTVKNRRSPTLLRTLLPHTMPQAPHAYRLAQQYSTHTTHTQCNTHPAHT